MDEKRLYKIVVECLERGSNVEIRRKSDGSMQVMEVKKKNVT